MIELNVHLLVAEGIERAFVCQNSEKPCVLDKVDIVYFIGMLYFSRSTRFYYGRYIVYID